MADGYAISVNLQKTGSEESLLQVWFAHVPEERQAIALVANRTHVELDRVSAEAPLRHDVLVALDVPEGEARVARVGTPNAR